MKIEVMKIKKNDDSLIDSHLCEITGDSCLSEALQELAINVWVHEWEGLWWFGDSEATAQQQQQDGDKDILPFTIDIYTPSLWII